MSIASNFPAIKPTLLLDFANTEELDPRITFTRASTATYYGTQTAKAEENLLIRSQEFNTGWSLGNITTTANNEVAPDGTTTAETITVTASNTQHFFNQVVSPVAGPVAVSVFAKAGTHPYFQVIFTTQTGSFANFDVTAGAGTTGTSTGIVSSSVTDVGNGWYRCSLIVTNTNTSALGFAIVDSASAARNPTWTAAGTETIYFWGAQLEQRSAVTAYTPTTTQAITNYIPVLETAASGVARFDHNPTTFESLGLLIEESRTNLVTYSAQFDNAAWTKTRASITANTVVAPDGTLTGDKLVEDTTASNTHQIQQTATIVANTTYTISLYVKAVERTEIRLLTSAGGDGINAIFNLSTQVATAQANTGSGVISSATITSVGNGWFRISATGLISPTSTSLVITWRMIVAGGNTYTGNGYSGIYIWGAQLEAGAFPTSYIPTVASQVTRAADAASMTGVNFSSWYNQAEGTFYHELNTPNAFAAFANFGASDGSTTNQIGLQLSTTRQIRGIVKSSNTSSFAANLGSIPSGFYKVSMAYKFNDSAICLNASAVTTDTSVDVPNNMNQISISGQGNSANGTIKKIAYYPIRCTNAQLQGLTS